MGTESIANIAIKSLKTKDILGAILSIFKIPDVPAPPIDPPSILTTATRPGMSPRKIWSNILSELPSAGAPFGPLPSGAENVSEKVLYIQTKEMIKALQQDARITVSIPPGILVNGFAMSPAGPIPVIAVTTSPAHVAYAVAQ
jgi:hypothetical protein